jgi:hypothetical protein
MKKNKEYVKSQSVQIIFASLILLWMVLLTAFTIWHWNQHIWQARVDNEAIFKLMTENATQQTKIDELGK